MRLPASVCIAVACLFAATACQALDFKDEPFQCYKLTEETVTPSKYELNLTFLSLDTDVYGGKVDIDLNIGGADNKIDSNKSCRTRGALDEIVLHADESLDIKKIELTKEKQGIILLKKNRLKDVKIKGLYRDRTKQMIKIKLKRMLTAGTRARLSISFSGRMRTDKLGIYVSQYNDGSRVYKQIVSQFRPAFARTVFPCFDEPQFRVPFVLTLHHPKELTAYSNTNGQYEHNGYGRLAITKFEKTPAMPLHMVAFTVGQFDEPLETTLMPSTGRDEPVKIRVITTPGKRDTGKFALDMAAESLKWFERYIDYLFPLDKLDIIAVADLDKDNVESWGLAYIRDTKIWIDNETRNDTRVTTAINVAHVVVHQWFGNLISVENWRDIWMTESVASNMAFKFVEEFYPLESKFLVRLEILSRVMEDDQTGEMHALAPPEEELLTSKEIYGILDILEFMKSASAGQMLIEYVGEHQYKPWLRRLVSDHAYKTIPSGIHRQLLKERPDFATTLDSFIDNAGLQLVDAKLKDNSILLSAEPYNTADETFGSGNVLSKLAICTRALFFKHQHLKLVNIRNTPKQIPLPEWFETSTVEDEQSSSTPEDQPYFKVSRWPSISNYFRTRYSDDLFEMLIKAIGQDELLPMNRIQLLDDANHMVQTSLIKREKFAKLVAAYKDESSSAVLIELLAVNKTLEGLGLESPLEQTFMNVFEEHGFKVTGDESLLEQRARQDILKALVAQQVTAVVRAALKAFERSQGGNVAIFLREPVYAAVVQAGTPDQVRSLFDKLRKTSSYEEKIRLITALASYKDKELLTKLQDWLKSSGLKADTIKPFEDTINVTLAS